MSLRDLKAELDALDCMINAYIAKVEEYLTSLELRVPLEMPIDVAGRLCFVRFAKLGDRWRLLLNDDEIRPLADKSRDLRAAVAEHLPTFCATVPDLMREKIEARKQVIEKLKPLME